MIKKQVTHTGGFSFTPKGLLFASTQSMGKQGAHHATHCFHVEYTSTDF